MAGLTWSPSDIARSALSLQSVFVWLLLALLIAGAASYSYGSRYALVGHSAMQPASVQAAGPEGDEAAPPLPAANPRPYGRERWTRRRWSAGCPVFAFIPALPRPSRICRPSAWWNLRLPQGPREHRQVKARRMSRRASSAPRPAPRVPTRALARIWSLTSPSASAPTLTA